MEAGVRRKLVAGPRDTVDLPVESGPIGDVHGDVLGPRQFKMPVLEREGQCVGASVIDFVGEPAAFGQECRYLDEGGTQIDTDDAATVLRCQVARRAAESGPNIDDPFAGSNGGHFGQLYGGRQAARVELIQRRKVDRRKPLASEAGLSQRIVEPRDQPVAAIVTLKLVSIGHRQVSSFFRVLDPTGRAIRENPRVIGPQS
jgi:hypothetical protein